MIETLQLYSQHTLIGTLSEGLPDLVYALIDLVHRIAMNIMIQVLISIPLFYLHHNLFALGFVVGFVFDEQVRVVVEKVNLVYSAKRTRIEQFVFFGGGGFIAILTMPTSMIIATLYYSAQWGAYLYQSNSANKQQVEPISDNPKK